MKRIDMLVYLDINSNVTTEEKKKLLNIPIGLFDTKLISEKHIPTINSSKFKLLLTFSLNNTNMDVINQIINSIVCILSQHKIWVQYQIPIESSSIFEGNTSVKMFDNTLEVYSMDGYYKKGIDLDEYDDLRKDDIDFNNLCLNRDGNILETINEFNQAHLRVFNDNEKTIYIMDGFVSIDFRTDKSNCYLLISELH